MDCRKSMKPQDKFKVSGLGFQHPHKTHYFQRYRGKNFKTRNYKTLQVSLIFAPQIFIPWLPNFPKKPISTGMN